jgi:hypothetical protein
MPVHKNMSSLASSIATIPAGSTGIPREVNAQGVYGYPTQSSTFSLPSNATDVGDYVLYGAFYNCISLVSSDLSSLVATSGRSAFSYAFSGCTNLTSVNFNSLATVSGGNSFSSAFYSCSSLASVSFPALATLTGSYAFNYAFSSCVSLTSVSFPALTTSSFGSRTNQFSRMLQGCTGVTVHFPSAIQSTIGSWSDVTAGFGGTNTTVLFDL